MKNGVLLFNLGTPDSPEPGDVGRYLQEFLMDPYVVDIPAPLRWFLVNVLIVPKRKYSSSEAYRKIWTAGDSPLRIHHHALAAQLKLKMPGVVIEEAMRYGQPSTETALKNLKAAGVTKIFVMPLYPQYSWAATESSIVHIKKTLENLNYSPEIKFLEPFYRKNEFLNSFSLQIQKHLHNERAFVLFSYHGIPVRHLTKPGVSPENNYKTQCEITSVELARRLNLSESQYAISYQSRLGRTPWIEPFTDFVIPDLARSGVKDLVVACPSFVADCLETLEEIGMRAKEDFVKAGGRNLTLVPSLNSESFWVETVGKWISAEFPKATQA